MAERKTYLPVTFLSLFTSVGTLLCCALPALLVSLGMGAVVAGLVSNIPQLVWLSERKSAVFGVAGLLLVITGFLIYRSRNLPCPVDPALRNACLSGRKWSLRIYLIAAILFLIGVFFSYALPIFL